MATREQKVREQAEKAAASLLKYLSAREEKKNTSAKLELLDSEPENILLSVGLSRIPDKAFKSFKGKRIELPNPWVKLTEDSEVCLLAKDRKEAEGWLEKAGVVGVKKVVDLHELRTKYNAYSERRELCANYDAFVADDRIVCMLPQALGKIFYSGPKRPAPVRLAQRNTPSTTLQTKIEQAVQSTYFYFSGSCSTVRVGRSDFTAKQIAENVMATVEVLCVGKPDTKTTKRVPAAIPRGWKGVQSLHLKSNTSVALPLYEYLSNANVVKDESQLKKKRSAAEAVDSEEAELINTKTKVAKKAKTVEKKAKTPAKTVEKKAKTPAKSVGKKAKTPTKSVEKKAQTPKKTAQKKAKTPSKTTEAKKSSKTVENKASKEETAAPKSTKKRKATDSDAPKTPNKPVAKTASKSTTKKTKTETPAPKSSKKKTPVTTGRKRTRSSKA